ncbi:MAG: antibiotic biosynthesis monooxygenase [Bauldia sp.]
MTKKYIMGWLHFKPGKRDAFIAGSRDYVGKCRAESGCEFFDVSVSPFDSDLAMVMECFTSPEVHEAEHLNSRHFKQFWAALGEVCVEAHFENILSDTVIPDTTKFA